MRAILVHGAMHGAWCWELLLPRLRELGVDATAIDLPGSDGDLQAASLAAYTRAIVAEIDRADTPVVLVGHSLGGLSITTACEARPDKIAHLIYLSALVPADSDTGMELLAAEPGDRVADRLDFAPDGSSFIVAAAARVNMFYHDCEPAVAAAAAARLVPQSFKVHAAVIGIRPDRSGAVPKTYILTTEDRCISTAFQETQVKRCPGMAVRRMASGHSPFLSQPEELARMIVAIIEG